ncbi:polyprenyl diphosphate synthase [Oceanobacillus sp. CAU 1775]
MDVKIPRHVGLIMDGNGRWGKAHGTTRSQGHYAGVQAMEKVIDASIDNGIEVLTLYAFSSENWSRSKEEVNYLMRLPIRFFKQKLPAFMRRNIKIVVSGDIDELPEATNRVLNKAISETENNTGLVVNFAFNYGGRVEIMKAMQGAIQEAREKGLEMSEDLFESHLYTSELPDPDLIIRTGGEQRLSNFLLWQCAKAELYFTDIYFPDFGEKELQQALVEYHERKAVYDFADIYKTAE